MGREGVQQHVGRATWLFEKSRIQSLEAMDLRSRDLQSHPKRPVVGAGFFSISEVGCSPKSRSNLAGPGERNEDVSRSFLL